MERVVIHKSKYTIMVTAIKDPNAMAKIYVLQTALLSLLRAEPAFAKETYNSLRKHTLNGTLFDRS